MTCRVSCLGGIRQPTDLSDLHSDSGYLCFELYGGSFVK